MTKKTIGYVELAWTCPHCEVENPGPRKFCTGCGAPQPDDVQFHQLENAVLLTEEADIRRAKAGPDVHCPYCNARNPADADFCGACGGGLSDAEARQSGGVIGAYRQQKGLERKCTHCATLNVSSALDCAGCGASLSKAPPGVPASMKPSSTKREGLTKYMGIGCLAIILIGAALFIFSLLSKEQISATVEQVEWTRTVPILAMAPVETEAWSDEVPVDASNVRCSEELRETSPEPIAGAVEICGTPYTIDEGSGYGEVVQDCSYELYDQFCSYTIMDWTIVESVTASGTDLEPYWPNVQLAAGQEAGDGESEYAVIFEFEGDTVRYYPEDEVEFSDYLPGSAWVIEVNKIGGVSVIEPLR